MINDARLRLPDELQHLGQDVALPARNESRNFGADDKRFLVDVRNVDDFVFRRQHDPTKERPGRIVAAESR